MTDLKTTPFDKVLALISRAGDDPLIPVPADLQQRSRAKVGFCVFRWHFSFAFLILFIIATLPWYLILICKMWLFFT